MFALRTALLRSSLLPTQYVQNHAVRFLATAANNKYDAIIIGGGPGGLTCASNLLDQGLANICMIDEKFTAGRINDKYREVPSNTKAVMFEKWATGTKAFQDVIKKAPDGNAYKKLQSFNQDKGCKLGEAIDVAQLLSDGLRQDKRVHSIATHVKRVRKDGPLWSLPELDIQADRVVLAVGSHPREHNLAEKYPNITRLNLDIALKPSALREILPAGSRVGVVGSSHSAILAVKNLYELGDVDVINFYRSALLYAIYKEGWILYDNTGLKGMAADWARDVLAGKSLDSRLHRVNVKDEARSAQEIYDDELPKCTHLVSAIGYDMNPLPEILVDGKDARPEFDPLTGRFWKTRGSKEVLPGLFGAGIAYPERVTDPAGNVESAVGWFKFMKFVKRVSPEWVQKP